MKTLLISHHLYSGIWLNFLRCTNIMFVYCIESFFCFFLVYILLCRIVMMMIWWHIIRSMFYWYCTIVLCMCHFNMIRETHASVYGDCSDIYFKGGFMIFPCICSWHLMMSLNNKQWTAGGGVGWGLWAPAWDSLPIRIRQWRRVVRISFPFQNDRDGHRG